LFHWESKSKKDLKSRMKPRAIARTVLASLTIPLFCMALSLMASRAAAHHSAAMYDDKKTISECVPTPAPFLMVTPDLKRITRADNVILIEGEFDNAQRTIHMDMNSHEGAASSIQGHSVGHWEGGSLYIDTTLFAPHAMGNGYGVPSGAAKHLTERLTPDASGTTLTYHFEVTDPEFLSHPVQGDLKWEYRPNLTYAPPKCDPENARRSFRTN
jgi:hypothetical protein